MTHAARIWLIAIGLLFLCYPQRIHAASYSATSTAYDWVVTTGHTVLNTWDGTLGCPGAVGDDSLSLPVNIGFAFRFGTSTYTQLRINANGRVQFANTRCNYGTQTVGPPRTYVDNLPSSALNNVIALYVVDEDVSSAGSGSITYATVGTAPDRRFVVTWNAVAQWNAVGSSYNLQLQLREDGTFAMMYGTIVDRTTASATPLGPGQRGFQLTTSDYSAVTGVPTSNSGELYSNGSNTTGLRISYSASGIYCLDQLVTITPVNATGATVTGYTGTVNLTTTTGRGSWLTSSASGTLTDSVPDDGAATYVWNPAQSSATLLLRYRAGGATVTANARDANFTSTQDDGSQGSITFTPDGFTVTSAPLATPHPASIPAFASPQTAGSNVPIYLTAYGQLPADATCGVITTYTGAKSLRFWSTYGNPGAGTLAPTIDATTIATTEGSAAAQAVTFASGKASVTMKYKDAGSLGVGVKDTTTGSPLLPSGIRGSTGSFIVRPSTLVVSAVTTVGGVANPAAATATGAGFVSAGAPFRVQVQARDAEGAVTPNFGLETPAEGVRIAASLVLPVAGRNGTTNDGAIGNATAFSRTAAGTFTATTVYWDEVGVITLRPSVSDGDYLASGALTGTLSGNVGRIYPASINLLAGSTVTPACGLATYMEQPALGAQFTLEARNTQGVRTQNYDLGLLGNTAVGGVALAAENANSGVNLAARISGFSASWAYGRVNVSIASLLFARDTSMDGPFDRLRIGVTLTNPLDGLVIASADMNESSSAVCSVSTPCTAALLGSAESGMFYGRMVLRPGLAPENANLDMGLLAQYWDGSAFRTLVADSCSSYLGSSAALSNYTGNLGSGDTAVIGPASSAALTSGLSARLAPLRLAAPGMGHEGSVRVTLAVPVWLKFPWGGGVAINPFAIALFGHYRGHDRIIYRHEVF